VLRIILVLVVALARFAGIRADAADGLGVTDSVTLANCVESSGDVICDVSDISVAPSVYSGLYVGGVAVFTCEPNAAALAISIMCDARISTGAIEGDPLSIQPGDRIALSGCIVQPVYSYPTYDDYRLLPFIRIDCALGPEPASSTGQDQPWVPDIAPFNPDDVTWPPIVSGSDFPTSACAESGNGSYICAPDALNYGYIRPQQARLSDGDRVAFTLTAGGVRCLSFFRDGSHLQPAVEGAFAGDLITFTDCTRPLLADRVYMRSVKCTVGAIEPGPRPRS
jgi:hypothetical protein